MSNPVDKRVDQPVVTPTQQQAKRIDSLNDILDNETKALLRDLEITASDLDSLIEILKDRVVNSNEPSLVIALTRVGELRLDVYKKKIDVLKTLVTDKGNELAAKKKVQSTDLDSILSGAALGAALGAKIGSTQTLPAQIRTVDIIDMSQPAEFEIEHVNNTNVLNDEEINSLLDDSK